MQRAPRTTADAGDPTNDMTSDPKAWLTAAHVSDVLAKLSVLAARDTAPAVRTERSARGVELTASVAVRGEDRRTHVVTLAGERADHHALRRLAVVVATALGVSPRADASRDHVTLVFTLTADEQKALHDRLTSWTAAALRDRVAAAALAEASDADDGGASP